MGETFKKNPIAHKKIKFKKEPPAITPRRLTLPAR
jgi:hypothetical protein